MQLINTHQCCYLVMPVPPIQLTADYAPYECFCCCCCWWWRCCYFCNYYLL